MTLPFNKVCEIEDFQDPELSSVIRDVFPNERELAETDSLARLVDSKQWEVAMSCRALNTFGALTPTANILGVGAGTEATSFYLTQHVKQVLATDCYLFPGSWVDVAPALMLVDPERYAPYPFERDRLIVQHMDGRRLRYPDDTFDGVYSSGSIEHFGSLEFIANAAYEMGRVVKPGGIVTLATEFKIAGPPGEDGWDTGTLILSEERIRRYVIQASGLEPVDQLSTTLSEETLACERDLTSFLRNAATASSPEAKAASYPNLVLVHEGYVFCSVHLTLRKGQTYPLTDNAWARPSRATERAIADDVRRVEQTLAKRTPLASLATIAASTPMSSTLDPLLRALDLQLTIGFNTRPGRRLPAPLARLYRTFLRVFNLGRVWQAESALLHALRDELEALRRQIDSQRDS